MPRNYLSGSIRKALSIVECVGKSPRPLKASEVAKLTKLERATAFRILTISNKSWISISKMLQITCLFIGA